MAAIRQTNFSGGELAPWLWGRTDHPLFGKGARKIRGFVPTKHGPAVSRPGTEYLGHLKQQSTNTAVRLVPFVYSDEQAYCLVFGHNYVRFYLADGAPLETSPGVYYEVATTYAAAQLRELQWVQSGDVLFLTHPEHPPRTLSRLGPLSWALAPLSFDPEPGYTHSTACLIQPLPTEDIASGMPAREWAWAVTDVMRRPDGTVYETTPYQIAFQRPTVSSPGSDVPAKVAVYPEKPVTVGFNTAGLTADQRISIRIYRGRGGLFGWVGDVEPAGSVTYFTDAGQEPDYAIAPPRGDNPFKPKDPSGAVLRTEHPRALTFFQERLVFGATSERPGFLFFSTTGDYTNFDQRQVALDEQALLYELASRTRIEIRWLVGLGAVVAGTSGAIWSFSGSGGDPIAATVQPDARVVEEIGATSLRPLVVDGALLYVRAKGTGARALVFSNERGGLVGLDVSLHSQHLFSGPTGSPIVDWTYAEDPFGVVWAVTEGGKLLSLTPDVGQEMWAWAQHPTAGFVKAVCSVPSAQEDAVFLAVLRSGDYVLERMTSRISRGDASGWMALDSAVSMPTLVSSSPTVVPGLAHLDGKEVYALAFFADRHLSEGPAVFGPLAVSGGEVEVPALAEHLLVDDLPLSAAVVWVGLLHQPELETLDVAASSVRHAQKTVREVGIEVDSSRGLHVGQDLQHLVPWRQRAVADSYAEVGEATEVVRVPVKGTWNNSARAAIRQTEPRQVTVVGITRDVEVGG